MGNVNPVRSSLLAALMLGCLDRKAMSRAESGSGGGPVGTVGDIGDGHRIGVTESAFPSHAPAVATLVRGDTGCC